MKFPNKFSSIILFKQKKVEIEKAHLNEFNEFN